MLFAILRISDGSLVSTTTSRESVADQKVIDEKGFTVKEIDIAPEDAGGAWDSEKQEFLPKPVEYPREVEIAQTKDELNAAAEKLRSLGIETTVSIAEAVAVPEKGFAK